MKRALILWCLLVMAVPVLGTSVLKTGTQQRCATCARDARGRIARSAAVRRQFVRTVPRPAKCLNTRCEVDHIVALHCGGRDAVSNLQWLTRAEHRAKTKREAQCNSANSSTK